MQAGTDSTVALIARLEAQVESVKTALVKIQDQLAIESKTTTKCKTRLFSLEHQTTTQLDSEFSRIKAVIDPLASATTSLQDKLSEFNKILERHQVELSHIENAQLNITEKVANLEKIVYDLDRVKLLLEETTTTHCKDVESIVHRVESLETTVSDNTEALKRLRYIKSILIALLTGFAGVVSFLIMVREHILEFVAK